MITTATDSTTPYQRLFEHVPLNVMMADTNFNIVFVNPESEKTLRKLEQHLALPVDQLVGAHVDIFSKGSSKLNMPSDPSALPFQAEITVGQEHVKLTASAVFDEDGNFAGPMVTWELTTDQWLIETERDKYKSMLENAPTNVMFADPEFNITYINPASVDTLKGIDEHLPVTAEQVLGSNIDIFHKEPSYQRRLLADPKGNLPRRSNIKIGPEVADLLVSPVYDSHGDYLGAMVTWEVITEKLKMEREQARMRSMLENAPVNILMADDDFNINYVNPASLETLKEIEQHLPIRADQVLGANIDIFHKDPSHQRRMLADPKNLPHRAEIQIGPEWADLLVSPVYDDKGGYIGPMVTWEVITEQKKAAEREKKLQAMEKLKELMERVSVTAEALGRSSSELSEVSEQMTTNAQNTSEQAGTASAAAEEITTNVQTVATAAEEMSTSIREIAKNATEAAQVAAEAVAVAETTNVQVGKLGDSSQEIGGVIKVIASIAQQTNLLALNATIEAARAGEAGKGFAVVANEVKELAKETANATEEISRKIEAIQGDTKGAVEAISQIGSIIGQINDRQNTIASAVEEQTATTNEISRSVQEAARGSSEVSENLTIVAEAAGETSEGASKTQTSSSGLAQMASELQEMVNEFREQQAAAEA